MDFHNIERVWPEYRVDRELGKGSFGEVYQVSRDDGNLTSFAAVKVITIPKDLSEIESIRADGFDDAGIQTYLKGIVDDFIGEIKVMVSLKGISNIVTVEDYRVVKCPDNISWKIYIRMELLTSFNEYLASNKLTEADVLKMGLDICTALEMCSKCNIIHRDIKPENIFVNRFGIFKLGDFGIARRIDNVSVGLSQKGTFNYMAPEVYFGNVYDQRVDIYSLGIVMYKLLNRGLFPFLTAENALSHDARQNALDKRLRGNAIPAPCKASPETARIILKACTFRPEDRYQTAVEMKADIIKVLYAVSGSAASDPVSAYGSIPYSNERQVGAAKKAYAKPVSGVLTGINAKTKGFADTDSEHRDYYKTEMLNDSQAMRDSPKKEIHAASPSNNHYSNKSNSPFFKEPEADFFSHSNIPRTPVTAALSDAPESHVPQPSHSHASNGASSASSSGKRFKPPEKL